ncbi:MAG: hypothetical protein KAT34_05445 [Candidatus Aminicenantes bacterium]|nr:hypothetical protein [Candidatus Aminicenantes bacterium]
MKKTKPVFLNVQCAFDKSHIFPKSFTVEEGGQSVESEVDVYCPFCNKLVVVKIKGELPSSESILRKFTVN